MADILLKDIMDAPRIPAENYIGLLQTKCAQNKVPLPRYEDVDTGITNGFKVICYLEEWSSEGTGFSKKFAKHNAAKAMYEKIENENLLGNCETKSVAAGSNISKINNYCSREKKEMPLFSDAPKEDGLFVVSCTFDGFTAVGKGSTKKIAKEEAADAIAKHFNIHKYHDNFEKSKARRELLKNPCQELHEYCQPKQMTFIYNEDTIKISNQNVYIMTCTVGDVSVKSSQSASKKQAKMDAASQMLNLLKNNTPNASPAASSIHIKFDRHSDSCDDEPLTKRIRSDQQ